jgi:hypothetical protein
MPVAWSDDVCVSRATNFRRVRRAHRAGIDLNSLTSFIDRSGGMSTTKIASWLMAIIAVVLAVLGGKAISAQDYTAQVPNCLAFSDFRGYEDWQVVSIAQTDEVLKVIVANPAMIAAYKAGVPGNGGKFPDGSKIAKNPVDAEKEYGGPVLRECAGHFERPFLHRIG